MTDGEDTQWAQSPATTLHHTRRRRSLILLFIAAGVAVIADAVGFVVALAGSVNFF